MYKLYILYLLEKPLEIKFVKKKKSFKVIIWIKQKIVLFSFWDKIARV